MKITVKHILADREPVEFDDAGWFVEFGEGQLRLHVARGPDGKIDMRSPNGNPISIEPRAANSAWVSAIRSR